MRNINIAQIIGESKLNSFHFKIIAMGVFILVCDGFDMMVYGTVIPSLIEEWGLTSSTAGYVGSLTLLGSLIGCLVSGTLGDKLGRKKVIIFGFIIFNLFTLLAGFAQGPLDFSIYRFVAGLGLGGMPPLITALTFEYSPKKSSSMLIGMVSTGFAVGGMLVALLGIFVIPNIGWQWMFYLAAIPLLTVPFLIKHLPESLAFLVVKGEDEKVRKILERANPTYEPIKDDKFQVNLPTSGMTVKKLFEEKRSISTLAFWVTSFMVLLVVYGLGTWLPKLMVEAGFPLKSSLIFLFALNIGAVTGQVGGGWLADRLGSKRVIVIMFLIGSLSLIFLGFRSPEIIMYLLVAIAGACSTGTSTVNNAYLSLFYPTFIRSTGIGWSLGIGRFGAVIGPIFGGFLLDLSLPTHVNFIGFAFPGVLAAIAICFIQEKYSNFKNPILARSFESLKHEAKPKLE
ncbi:MFS transporter [Psychrobacillus sp. NPDC096426]|uniref:MFS transporter n=1 Tax=Psychrobacillus sp. NPDC096426 TaxID=3364491 RepID=UPI003824C22A